MLDNAEVGPNEDPREIEGNNEGATKEDCRGSKEDAKLEEGPLNKGEELLKDVDRSVDKYSGAALEEVSKEFKLVLLKDSKESSEDFKEEPKLELGNSNGPEEDERNGREEDSKGKPELDESGDRDEGPTEEEAKLVILPETSPSKDPKEIEGNSEGATKEDFRGSKEDAKLEEGPLNKGEELLKEADGSVDEYSGAALEEVSKEFKPILLNDKGRSTEDCKEVPELKLGNISDAEEDERNGREEDSKGKPELDESGDKDEGPMEIAGKSNKNRGDNSEESNGKLELVKTLPKDIRGISEGATSEDCMGNAEEGTRMLEELAKGTDTGIEGLEEEVNKGADISFETLPNGNEDEALGIIKILLLGKELPLKDEYHKLELPELPEVIELKIGLREESTGSAEELALTSKPGSALIKEEPEGSDEDNVSGPKLELVSKVEGKVELELNCAKEDSGNHAEELDGTSKSTGL